MQPVRPLLQPMYPLFSPWTQPETIASCCISQPETSPLYSAVHAGPQLDPLLPIWQLLTQFWYEEYATSLHRLSVLSAWFMQLL